MTKKDQLIYWLGDAHALEVGLVTTLEKQIAEAKGLPKVRALLSKHLAETKKHATAIKNAWPRSAAAIPFSRKASAKLRKSRRRRHSHAREGHRDQKRHRGIHLREHGDRLLRSADDGTEDLAFGGVDSGR